MMVLLQLPLANGIKLLVTIIFLQRLSDFSPVDSRRAIVDNSTDHWTLFSISETGSQRIADFRLVGGRRKETRGITLKPGWENDERILLLAPEVNALTDVLFHPLPKYLSSHYQIHIKLLIQYFLLSLGQGVPQWCYRSLKLFFIVKTTDEHQYLLRSSCHPFSR